MNLFSKTSPQADLDTIRKIKFWIYQQLNLDREIIISINQLQCHQPDCPPVETVIAIMTTPPQQYKIHKSVSEITQADNTQFSH